MDHLFDIIGVPLSKLLVLAGIAFVFLTFFEVSKSGVKPRKMDRKNYLIPVVLPVVIGLALIGVGVRLTPDGTPPTPEETPTAVTNTSTATVEQTLTPVIDTATATKSPTETPTLTPSPTDTVTPSLVPILTLHDGCIADQTWQVKSSDANIPTPVSNIHHCMNLNDFGFAAETDGTLHLIATTVKVQSSAGIFTNVGDRSTVEFSVFVDTLYMAYDDNPAYISFAIAPSADPTSARGSARFKLQIKKSGNSPIVFFTLADPNQNVGTELGTQHYRWGRIYKFRFVLKGIDMEVYIDNVKLDQTISIPSGAKVFYIGYNMPILAKADVNISNIVIDGVDQ
jgi:hypothetical protein